MQIFRYTAGYKWGLFLILFVLSTDIAIAAESPDQQEWRTLMSRPVQEPVIPEDDVLGLLANLRRPAIEWVGGITVCEQAFKILSDGEIPDELLDPDMRVPLALDLETALGDGFLQAGRRYGLPVRSGSRLDVPLRLSRSGEFTYGHIYLVRREQGWKVEQWSLSLQGFVSESDSE